MLHRIATATIAALVLTATVSPAAAQQAAAPAKYDTKTTPASTLLADPAAAAVLERLIPTVYGNPMFRDNAASVTLSDVQTYEPDVLTNEKLAQIQAELDKLPPKPAK